MNATDSPNFTDAPERIAQLIYVLCQTVTMRCGPRVRALTQEQVKYICERLWASRTRFLGLVARIRAGNPPTPRARKPRVRKVRPKRLLLRDLEREFADELPPGWRSRARRDRARARAAEKAAREAAAATKPVPLWRALRQHVRGWLCPLVPQIPGFANSAPAQGNYLREILAEPGMQALLLAHPSVGEALRSVCNALGVDKSLLHLVPRAVVDPAPIASESIPSKPAVSESEPEISRGEVFPRPSPASASVTADKPRAVPPASRRPAAEAERAKPPSRAAPGSGVVIIDYWAKG